MRFTFKHPWIHLTPALSAIALDDILSGNTCQPIGLADFESYLEHKEHSVENLRFVVWYQSYRRRFFALPPAKQKLSPGSRQFSFALPTPARTAQHISRMSSRATTLVYDEPLTPNSALHSPTTSTSPTLSRTSSVPLTASSSIPSRAYMHTAPEKQPLRDECTLVAATFLLPSAPYELMLPSLLLSTILRDVALNTHPDVFLPAYEYAYDALLTSSLPRFLEIAQQNMNWEKKLYWWLYGIMTSCVGWAIVIGCLFISYDSHTTQGRLRAWRLLGVPFLSLGAMQMYAAYRGFCTQIWGRGGMQLRPWELSYPPASSDIPSPPTTSSGKKSRRMSMSSAGSMRKDSEVIELFELPSVPSGVLEEQCESTDEILELPRADGDVGPSTSRLPPHGLSPIITNGYRDSWDLPSLPTQSASPTLPISDPQQHKLQHRKSKFSLLSKRSRHDAPYSVPPTPTLSTRARVFGPERVVLDPRIREVHKRVLRDILLSGFVLGTTLTVVVLALPHAR